MHGRGQVAPCALGSSRFRAKARQSRTTHTGIWAWRSGPRIERAARGEVTGFSAVARAEFHSVCRDRRAFARKRDNRIPADSRLDVATLAASQRLSSRRDRRWAMSDTGGSLMATAAGCALLVRIVALSRESATIASRQTAAWMWRPGLRAKGSVHTEAEGAPCWTRRVVAGSRRWVARGPLPSSRFRAKARQSHPRRQPPGCGDPGREPKAQFTRRSKVRHVGHVGLSHGHGGGLRAARQNRRAFARKRDNRIPADSRLDVATRAASQRPSSRRDRMWAMSDTRGSLMATAAGCAPLVRIVALSRESATMRRCMNGHRDVCRKCSTTRSVVWS